MINRLREHILSLFDDFVSKHDSTESPRSSCYIDLPIALEPGELTSNQH